MGTVGIKGETKVANEQHAAVSPDRRLLKRQDAAPVLFADGLANVAIGPSVVKLDLFGVVRIDVDPAHEGQIRESREIVATVVMPTAQAVEAALTVLRTVALNLESLGKAAAQQHENLARVLRALGPAETGLPTDQR